MWVRVCVRGQRDERVGVVQPVVHGQQDVGVWDLGGVTPPLRENRRQWLVVVFLSV